MSKEFKVSPETEALSARLVPLMRVNDKGVIDDTADKIFDTIAREDGKDPDEYRRMDDYRSGFLAATVHAGGVVTKSFMEENKDINTVSGSFELGRATLEFAIERHQRVPNRVLDKESGHFKVEGEKDLYGDTAVKFKMRGAQNSKGELKAVREHLHDNFRSAFGS